MLLQPRYFQTLQMYKGILFVVLTALLLWWLLRIFYKDQQKRITQLERNDTELKKSERRYKMLFDRSPFSKLIFDVENMRILDVNEHAVKHVS